MSAISLFGAHNSTYLVLAALLAAGGLATHTRELVIGSMLVSPFFVPIINMNKKGIGAKKVANNILILLASAAGCVLIGHIFGRFFPSPETESKKMIVGWNRSSTIGTVIAYLVPILSGIVIAVADKSQNIVPMVGVGIAISILPPLVNAGIYSSETDKWDETIQSLKFGMMNLGLGAISYTIAKRFLS